MKHVFLMVTLLFLIHSFVDGQVSKIKSQASSDSKNYSSAGGIRSTGYSSRSSYSDNESFGDAILADLVLGLAYGVVKGVGYVTVEAQKQVLDKQDHIPNLISFEGGLDYGSNLSELIFNPYIRGNWGLLATDFRYALLHDYSGTLQSLDWQVLILRIPIRNLKLNYGIGFTSLLDPKTTYFESSTGLDFSLLDNQMNFSSEYRWTARKAEERYRQQFKFTADYKVWEKGSLRISPSFGVTYQDYFKKHHYLFFNVGVKLRLY